MANTPLSDQKKKEILALHYQGMSYSQIAKHVGVCTRTVLRTVNAVKKANDPGDNSMPLVIKKAEDMTDVRESIDTTEVPPDLGEFAKKTLIYNLECLFKMLAKIENVSGAYGQVTAEITIRKEIRMTAAQIGQWAGLGKEAEVGNAILSEFSKKYLNQPLSKDLKFEE